MATDISEEMLELSDVKKENQYIGDLSTLNFEQKFDLILIIGVSTYMVKRTLKDVNSFSINSITDIKNLFNEFKKNKKILITGATGGIGKCLIEKFYNLESNIVATGTNEEKLNKLKNKYPKINTKKFKLDEHEKIEEFINEIDKDLGGLEILVNNAGITLDNLSIRLTEENWKKSFRCKSYFNFFNV